MTTGTQRLHVLAGHAWRWSARGPLHLASCSCWANGCRPTLAGLATVTRPPSSLWARLFGGDRG